MVSFSEYASENRILELLIKERVKVALKKRLSKADPQAIMRHLEANERLTVAEQIFTLMPPRDSWVRPRAHERREKESGLPRQSKQILTRSLALTIRRHRKTPEKYPYLQRLDNFIAQLRQDALGDHKLRFDSLRIFGEKKKQVGEVTILRPLCQFTSLQHKLLIGLANGYLSEAFDGLLHEEILSYRPLHYYHNSHKKVLTTREDAARNILLYRRRMGNRPIYVVECDIQKYFDTINHDVIRRCLRQAATEVTKRNTKFTYEAVERIIDAYLDCYSFYKTVVPLNAFSEKMRYETPREELFFERGCYEPESFASDQGKIGIPQGGALSGLISNVILSSIDRSTILAEPDCDLFFNRYGDDILLMHPSKERCRELIDRYAEALTAHKLLYHPFVSVASFCRPDGTTLCALWDQKSRDPFLWGRREGEREAADWIGFLGYEICRWRGEVRLRRSSFNDKFRRIKRAYYSAAKSKLAKGKMHFPPEKLEEEVLRKVNYFRQEGFVRFETLRRNKYSHNQALKLDRYTAKFIYRLLNKIGGNNHLTPDQIAHFKALAKSGNYMNYRATLRR